MCINNSGHMAEMAAMPYMVKTLQISSPKLWTDINETWHEVSMTQVLQCIYKS